MNIPVAAVSPPEPTYSDLLPAEAILAIGVTLMALAIIIGIFCFMMAGYVFTIWMIVDIIRSNQADKYVVWLILMILFLLFFPIVAFITALIYCISVKRNRQTD